MRPTVNPSMCPPWPPRPVSRPGNHGGRPEPAELPGDGRAKSWRAGRRAGGNLEASRPEGAPVNDKRSALDTLAAGEKATVLDELLAARPDLRETAEAYAVQVMTDADRSAVADDVEGALQGLDIKELSTRAGHRPGRGYVHPADAAGQTLAEALQPLLDHLN